MPAASTAVRYEAARPPPKEQILVVDAWGYTPPPPPDPVNDAADALIREAVALAARDASIDALAAPQSHPQRIRRPPPTAFVDPLAAAKAAAADAAAAEDERLDHLDGFSDEGGDDDDVTVEEEDEPEDFAAEAAAADAAAADARHAATPTEPKTPRELRLERRARRPPSAPVRLERPPQRAAPRIESPRRRRASSVGSAGGFSEDEADAAPPEVPPPFDDEAALPGNAAVVCEGASLETARMCLLPAHRILVRRRPMVERDETPVTVEAARALEAQRRLKRRPAPQAARTGAAPGDCAGHVQELILESRGDDVEAALDLLIERGSDDARQVCALVCCALRAGALTQSLVARLEAWLRLPGCQSGAVATAVLQARCVGAKALGGARLLYEDDTESSDGDEPLGALDEACDWAAFEEAGGCFELAFPVAFDDDDDGWRWDEAAALCFVSKHATTLRYDASLEAVARRDFRRAAAAILRAAHRDGVVAASCRALDALLDSGAAPARALAPRTRDDLASPRAPLVLAFLRADALARRGALGDGVPGSLRAVVPVAAARARDDVLERPRWRPWDDGVEAWLLASSAAEF
jgi:hypothetical protein